MTDRLVITEQGLKEAEAEIKKLVRLACCNEDHTISWPQGHSPQEIIASHCQAQPDSESSQPGWISVEERLPDEDELVLVAVRCESEDHDDITQRWEEVHEATLYTAPNTVIAATVGDGEYQDDEILGWMPLPKPPVAPGGEPSQVNEVLATPRYVAEQLRELVTLKRLQEDEEVRFELTALANHVATFEPIQVQAPQPSPAQVNWDLRMEADAEAQNILDEQYRSDYYREHKGSLFWPGTRRIAEAIYLVASNAIRAAKAGAAAPLQDTPRQVPQPEGTCDTTDWPHLASDGTGKRRPHIQRSSCTNWKAGSESAPQGTASPFNSGMSGYIRARAPGSKVGESRSEAPHSLKSSDPK